MGKGGGVRSRAVSKAAWRRGNQDGILPEAKAPDIPEQVDDGVHGKPFQIGGRSDFLRHHVEQLVIILLQFVRQQRRAYPQQTVRGGAGS